MPELPEVETIRIELSPWLVGECFTDVCVLDSKILATGPPDEFRLKLIGQRIEGLARRGKYLLFHLSGGASLIMHLRMTGSLLLDPMDPQRYVRVAFHLTGGHRFVFRDSRRFGLIWLVEDVKSVVGKLGPEPLSDDFRPRVLGQRISRRSVAVKSALLDQGVVAGIGNMYADEALFAARIHPLTRACELSESELETLCHCIRTVLLEAVECRGASVDTYLRPEGKTGTAQCSFKVAHRGGQPCAVCGSTIRRVRIQNRGTYFCPGCQPIEPGSAGSDPA